MFTMKRFIVFLCFFLAVSDSKQYCKESKCGNQAIRFPFSLMDDQHQLDDHCRYPGFELSCRNHKTLILKLPVSIEAQVEKIDFQFQEMYLSDPAGCLPSLLQNLNLSSTPFTRGRDEFPYYTYTLFNCSSINHGLSNPIKCLSTPRYTVQASRSDKRLDQNMVSCRRLYELENIPYGVIEDDEKIFRLRWRNQIVDFVKLRARDADYSPWAKPSATTSTRTTERAQQAKCSHLNVFAIYREDDTYNLRRILWCGRLGHFNFRNTPQVTEPFTKRDFQIIYWLL